MLQAALYKVDPVPTLKRLGLRPGDRPYTLDTSGGWNHGGGLDLSGANGGRRASERHWDNDDGHWISIEGFVKRRKLPSRAVLSQWVVDDEDGDD